MGEFGVYQEEPVVAAQPMASVPQLAAEQYADEGSDDDFAASMEREFQVAEPVMPAVAGPVEDDAPDFDFTAAAGARNPSFDLFFSMEDGPMFDPFKIPGSRSLHDRKLATWALLVGETRSSAVHAEMRRRPHRGMLPGTVVV